MLSVLVTYRKCTLEGETHVCSQPVAANIHDFWVILLVVYFNVENFFSLNPKSNWDFFQIDIFDTNSEKIQDG